MPRGFERPPVWFWPLAVVALVLLGVGLPYALGRGSVDVPAEAREQPAPPTASKPEQSTEPAETTVLFLGDSYAAGTRSTAPELRFTALVAEAAGWAEGNDAFGGTGYVAQPPADDAQAACGLAECPTYGQAFAAWDGAEPTLVVVTGGQNDVGAPTDDVADAAAELLSAIQSRYPSAAVVVTSPIWDDDPVPAALGGVAAAVQEGARTAGVAYLDIGQPLVDRADLMSEDGTHPNDAGHQAIADAVTRALVQSGAIPAR